MANALRWMRVLVTVALATGGGMLAVMWPGWLGTFRAEGSYLEETTAGVQQANTLASIALSTATVQSRNVGVRLAALRGGGGGAAGTALSLNIDGQAVPLSAVTALIPSLVTGGGASADASRGPGALGFFLNGQGSFGDQRATTREPGFDFHAAGVTLGGDYKLTKSFVVGAAFGYLNTETDFHKSAGDATTHGYSLSAYTGYFIAEKGYVDAILTYGWNTYDMTRHVTSGTLRETAKGDTNGTQFSLSVGGGYDISFGPVTLGPSLRANFTRVHIDGYVEHGADTFNLRVDSRSAESLTTDVGGQVSYAISTPLGVFVPLARVEWEHEFKADSRLVGGRRVANPSNSVSVPTNDPDRDYFNLGGGITATLRRGLSAFVYYEAVVDRDRTTNHSFTGGVRIELD